MARFTNKYGAHKAIVNAIEKDDHIVNGDISVTQLIGPPMVRYLKYMNKHDPNIKPDIRDMFFALFGTITHDLLEKGNNTYREYYMMKKVSVMMRRLADNDMEKRAAEYVGKFAEEKYGDKIDKDLYLERNLAWTHDGITISGTQDIYHAKMKILEDWKTCKVTQTQFHEIDKREWAQQLNIYAWILRRHGYEVEKIRVLAIYRDWSLMRLEQVAKGYYPTQPWDTFEIEIWPDEKVEAYIESRLEAHFPLGSKEIVKPRECTARERWAKNDSFAVMDLGRTKAIRLFDDRQKAQDYIDEYGYKLKSPWIEDRWGYDLKCKHYCQVSSVCETYQRRKDNVPARRARTTGRVKEEQKAFERAKDEFSEDLTRNFDVKDFLGDKFTKGKYKNMKEFRNDHKDMYEEEQNDPHYDFSENSSDPDVIE